MEIELIGIYPEVRNDKGIYGTLHVYVCDFGMDIRGIPFFKKKNNFKSIVFMPATYGPDYDEQMAIKFPLIDFTDKAKKNEFIEKIKKALVEEFKVWKCPANIPYQNGEKVDWSLLKLPVKKITGNQTLKTNPRSKIANVENLISKKPFHNRSNNTSRPQEFDIQKFSGLQDVSDRLKPTSFKRSSNKTNS